MRAIAAFQHENYRSDERSPTPLNRQPEVGPALNGRCEFLPVRIRMIWPRERWARRSYTQTRAISWGTRADKQHVDRIGDDHGGKVKGAFGDGSGGGVWWAVDSGNKGMVSFYLHSRKISILSIA